ncbi:MULTISPECIES: hypothetical protein [unclassified Wolbachia]|uniref:hypothetical protein n=1 Tax=unclassified Wolbachia TaxID=2640676 RepID=UPI002231A39D|nr:hypothetical protein [Wolbachia endosymbiont (group A) of Apoderus coryli]
MLAAKRYRGGMTVRSGMIITSSSRCLLADEIPRRYDVEAILLYSPTQLDPSSQGTGMTPFPSLSNYNACTVMELCNRHNLI